MSYSRRSVLRDAALLSLAGAASTPLALLSGCKKGQPPLQPRLAAPASFSDGIRIFFAGSWLFCADPSGKAMLAIARNMPKKVDHIFPYGQWNDSTGVDKNGTSQLQNNLTVSQKPSDLTPYQVTVAGFPSAGGLQPPPSVDALFQNTLDHDPFTYLTNFSNDVSVNLQTSDLRIISIPIPAQIIPAAFRSGALVSHTPKVPLARIGPYIQTGVATTHIFDYPGASSLTFSQKQVNQTYPGDITIPHASDSSADFHFHVLPRVPDAMDHGPEMFTHLLETLSSKSSSFQSTDLGLDTSALRVGLSVPTAVGRSELEIPTRSVLIDLASCSGGGVGLGGCDFC